MQPVISVSQLVDLLNQTMETVLPPIEVEGEVSGCRLWDNRLFFFDLKDDRSAVNCMLPREQAATPLEDGMKVKLSASPRLTRKGRFNIRVLSLEPVGVGSVYRAFELLKKQLEAEGLFAPERKRRLTEIPGHIGMVTSLESAAYKDFTKVLSQRMGGLQLTVVHTQVQGRDAPDQIVDAIDYHNQQSSPPDVLVLARGGGGPEDLAAFNAEPVARAIGGSRVPVVSAIGHETDITLADMAADVRAATPTDAARLVVPDKNELAEEVKRRRQELLDSAYERLNNWRQHIDLHKQEVHRLALGNLTDYSRRLEGIKRTLVGFNPESIMQRGYAVVRRDGQLIKSADQLSIGDNIVIQLGKGRVETEVIDVEEA